MCHESQNCQQRVRLLNESYRTTLLLALLTDRLALTDPSSPEFPGVLESVRAARESVEFAKRALEAHAAQCWCARDFENESHRAA